MYESDLTNPIRDDLTVRPAQEYEAPAIEATLTADELEREVLYAGLDTLILC